VRYGPERDQVADLYLPSHGQRGPTVVVIHGGFWRARYDRSLGAPLAADLARGGCAVLNLEYRRVGTGGGWPGTFADVASGIDMIATLPVRSDGVVVIGHSAGGQLAVWAASRPALPEDAPGAGPAVTVTGVVAQAAVLDLVSSHRRGVGGSAVADLIGAGPEQMPDRYRLADPMQLLPVAVPVVCVHARADAEVPFSQSERYVAAATERGGVARLVVADGDHYTLIDPASPDWGRCVEAVWSLANER
jgi:acetyl esterase/lipase